MEIHVETLLKFLDALDVARQVLDELDPRKYGDLTETQQRLANILDCLRI